MFAPDTRFLVIDDMKTMRIIVKKALQALGYSQIVEAEDGAKGLAELEKSIAAGTPHQVIISDWNMPNLLGIDLLRKVRAHASVGKMPFILLTAESEAHQVKEAETAGVSGYLVKPFTPEQLKEKLAAVHAKTGGVLKAA